MIYLGRIVICLALLSAIASGQEDWVKQSPPPAFNAVFQLNERTAIAVGERTDWWYGTSKGIVFRTSDGGHKWLTVHSTTTGTLNDVHFSDSLRGMAIGNGFGLRTTDGGLTWTESSVGSANPLISVHFSSATHGTIIGDGTFLRTTDGGTSWSDLSRGTINTLNACDVADSTTATAVGSRGTILRTTDAGITWNNQPSGTNGDIRDVMYTSHDAVSAIAVIDDPAQWDVRLGSLLRSSDGGVTWTSRPTGFTTDLNALHFLNADTGTVVGDGIILRTTDGGTTWIDQSGGTTRYLRAIQFADANTGWAVGDQGTILRTADGGLTWRNQASGTSVELRVITCWDALHATAFGSGWDRRLGSEVSIAVHTSDGGATWTELARLEGISIRSASFQDPLAGFAVGTRVQQGRAVILKTTDGGLRWSTLLEDPLSPGLSRIAFSDARYAVSVGYGSDSTSSQWGTVLFHTTDGGTSWRRRFVMANASLNDIAVNGPSTFTLVGSSNDSLGNSHPLILRSTNGGLDWTFQMLASRGSFNDIAFADPTTGVAFGDLVDSSGNWVRGQYRTTDGGATWSAATWPSIPPHDVGFSSSPFVGIVVGSDGFVFRSTDMGSTWGTVPRQVPGQLRDIDLLNATTGYAVGSISDEAFMTRTTNAGSSWSRVSVPWRGSLVSVHTFSADEAVVIGQRYDQVLSSDVSAIQKLTRAGDVITWTTLATWPQVYLRKLVIMDANVWMAFGSRRDFNWNYSSTVLRTTNAGASWAEVSGGTQTGLNGASFVDAHQGLAVGNGGNVVRTTDGGMTWSPASRGIPGTLCDVFFRDEKTGIAVGAGSSATGQSQAMIFRTMDGGTTWAGDSTGFSGCLSSLWFCDSFHVVTVGSEDSTSEQRGVVLTSIDAGRTWQKRLMPPSRYLYSVVFSGPTGLILGVKEGNYYYNDFVLFRTTDLGISWDTLSAAVSLQDAYSGEQVLTAASLSEGRVGTLVGRGNNWATYESAGMIFRTTDAGSTWVSQAGTDRDLLEVSFRDARTGIATGYEGLILRSDNGGLSWEGVKSGTRAGLHDVSWMDSLTVMAVGDEGIILLSRDAGFTWVVDSTSCRRTLHGSASTPDGFGVAVGDSGTVMITTDGGRVWSRRVLDVAATLEAVALVGHQTVFAVGKFDSASTDRAVLYRSTNAGSTWNRQLVDTVSGLTTIAFFDDQTGIATNAWLGHLRTTDGGSTWTTHEDWLWWRSSFNDLSIAGPHTAYAVGTRRHGMTHGYTAYLIMRTTDAGLSWEVLQDQVPGGLEGVSFSDANTGTVVGCGGLILRTTNGGTTWVIEKTGESLEIPRQAGLEQNYPNPFNPLTNVDFRLSNSGMVRIAIYDLLGREVAVLVDEEKAPGMYHVTWDASRMPTGVYFCRLSAMGVVETKKMILLK